MGSFHSHPVSFNITPAPAPGTQVGIAVSPHGLLMYGLNIQVAISTASGDLQKPGFDKNAASTEVIIAHLE